MSDIYLSLTYDEYKALEEQCKAFRETVHGQGSSYYHKSFRIRLGPNLTFEFHAPPVKARVKEEREILYPRYSPASGGYRKCVICENYNVPRGSSFKQCKDCRTKGYCMKAEV